jgi:ferredoxin
MKLSTNSKFSYFLGRYAIVNYSRNALDPSVEEYLLSLNLLEEGHDEAKKRLHIKIVKSLEIFYGKGKVTESNLHFFGEEGLKALAISIIREEVNTKLHPPSENAASSVITVRFKIPHHNTEFDLPWHYKAINADGQTSTLLDLRHASSDGNSLLSEYIEASCGGNCSCSTCHVYIDTSVTTDIKPAQAIELSKVTEAEQDMLDLAYQPNEKSRLACQVRILKIPPITDSSKTPQLTVTIPPGVNDLWK